MSNSVVGLILKLKAETGLERPNAGQDWIALGRQLNDDLFVFGTCLVWKVPNKLGGVYAVVRLEVSSTVPRPSTQDYPDGFYEFLPVTLGHQAMIPRGTAIDSRQVERLTQANELIRHEDRKQPRRDTSGDNRSPLQEDPS